MGSLWIWAQEPTGRNTQRCALSYLTLNRRPANINLVYRRTLSAQSRKRVPAMSGFGMRLTSVAGGIWCGLAASSAWPGFGSRESDGALAESCLCSIHQNYPRIFNNLWPKPTRRKKGPIFGAFHSKSAGNARHCVTEA